MIEIETPAVRVARGVALLDEHRPGWWKRIQVNALKMQNTCLCVIGQLEGNFERRGQISPQLTSSAVEFTGNYPARYHGFDAYDPHFFFTRLTHMNDRDARHTCASEMMFEDYEALRIEWTRVINERLALSDPPMVEWTHREQVHS